MPISFRVLLVIVLGVCLTSMLPVFAAITVARNQAREAQSTYAFSLAQAALRRSEITGEQLALARDRMRGLSRDAACSPAGLDLMREIDLSSTMLQGIGWIDGNVMRCSSFRGAEAIDLGPADYVSSNRSIFRTAVPLIDTDSRYVIVQTGNSAGVVHKDLALSFLDDAPGLGAAVFAWSTRIPLLVRGTVPAAYLRKPEYENGVMRDGERVIAFARSTQADLGAVAVLPGDYATDFARGATRVLVPIGALVGLVLSALFVYVMRSRGSMGTLIRYDIRRGKFQLVYQPVIELASGRVAGMEALLRWDRGERTPIGPDVFIPVAEQTGLITALTRHVLELLARDAPDIRRAVPDCRLGVNFSSVDLHREALLDELRDWSAGSGIPLTCIVAEATERGLLDIEKAGDMLKRLRGAGLRIAIDDFGTGYSSLAYLALLEVDYVKIDRLFVQALGTSAATSQVAQRIIEMAKDLGLQTVAEGIETREHEEQVRALGVDFVQGYFYARPMPPAQLLEWLGARSRGGISRAA